MADTLLGGIAINEVLVDPNGAINYDTDGNGTAASTDEFVEIVNTSASAIDISGLELWDQGQGNWYTFPPGTILEPGAHAVVVTDVQTGGSLPTGGPDDLAFDAANGGAVLNNGGDAVVLYDPVADEYIQVTYNGSPYDTPETDYAGFSATATQSGSGEDFGSDTDGESLQREGDGSDTIISDTPTPATPNLCFANGTHILTPKGEVLVEDLRPGDLVLSADHGPVALCTILSETRSPAQVASTPALAPVVFEPGSLGPNQPKRQLRLSQQHRILMGGKVAQRMFGATEVLVPARALLGLPGVSLGTCPTPITYFHLVLENHEVLIAEGTASESLFLGEQAVKSLTQDEIAELELIFGAPIEHLLSPAHQPPPARPFATMRRGKNMVRRLSRNNHRLVPQLAFAQSGQGLEIEVQL